MAELDTNVTTTTETTTTENTANNAETNVSAAEIARLKAALDKATKEAAESKRALRAKQTEEEAAAEEKRLADEARDKELTELRKKVAFADSSKKLMAVMGDEAAATKMAEYIYGADNLDAAIAEFNKAWIAKEKALRLEFGKIPAPGVGSADGATITKEQLNEMPYKDRIEFANKFPDEYNRLMGR